jgi:hypothetical protein
VCLLPVKYKDETDDNLCLLTDKCDLFILTEENLKERGLRLCPTEIIYSKLRVSGVKGFKSGDTCASCDTCGPTYKLKKELQKYIDLPSPYEYRPHICMGCRDISPTYMEELSILIHLRDQADREDKLSDFLREISFTGISSMSVTTPNLYRIINELRCTFIIFVEGVFHKALRLTHTKEFLAS